MSTSPIKVIFKAKIELSEKSYAIKNSEFSLEGSQYRARKFRKKLWITNIGQIKKFFSEIFIGIASKSPKKVFDCSEIFIGIYPYFPKKV